MVQNTFVCAARRIGILATHVQLTDGYLQGEQHMLLKHMHLNANLEQNASGQKYLQYLPQLLSYGGYPAGYPQLRKTTPLPVAASQQRCYEIQSPL